MGGAVKPIGTSENEGLRILFFGRMNYGMGQTILARR